MTISLVFSNRHTVSEICILAKQASMEEIYCAITDNLLMFLCFIVKVCELIAWREFRAKINVIQCFY